MKRIGRRIAVSGAVAFGAFLVFIPAATGAPRKLCYANARSGVFARNTTCTVAESVVEAVGEHYEGGLKPFTVRATFGTWRCGPYIHNEWNDILCRNGDRVVGVAIKE